MSMLFDVVGFLTAILLAYLLFLVLFERGPSYGIDKSFQALSEDARVLMARARTRNAWSCN